MGRMNKYRFAKRIYPNYVVFLVVKDKYLTYNDDLKIVREIKFKNKFKIFNKYKINYLILDDLDIIEKKEYVNNKYNKYLYLYCMKKIMLNIGNNIAKYNADG